MKKLKTLKEIAYNNDNDYGEANVGELRKEAIKWIKFLRDNYKESDICLKCLRPMTEHGSEDKKKCGGLYCSDYLTHYAYETTDYDGAIIMLKHFFNITEDDLK